MKLLIQEQILSVNLKIARLSYLALQLAAQVKQAALIVKMNSCSRKIKRNAWIKVNIRIVKL